MTKAEEMQGRLAGAVFILLQAGWTRDQIVALVDEVVKEIEEGR
jgi:hypothetical protein